MFSYRNRKPGGTHSPFKIGNVRLPSAAIVGDPHAVSTSLYNLIHVPLMKPASVAPLLPSSFITLRCYHWSEYGESHSERDCRIRGGGASVVRHHSCPKSWCLHLSLSEEVSPHIFRQIHFLPFLEKSPWTGQIRFTSNLPLSNVSVDIMVAALTANRKAAMLSNLAVHSFFVCFLALLAWWSLTIGAIILIVYRVRQGKREDSLVCVIHIQSFTCLKHLYQQWLKIDNKWET